MLIPNVIASQTTKPTLPAPYRLATNTTLTILDV